MFLENQHYVLIDRRTGKPVEQLNLVLFPQGDPHSRAALIAYARSKAKESIRDARVIQVVLRDLGYDFELFPGENIDAGNQIRVPPSR